MHSAQAHPHLAGDLVPGPPYPVPQFRFPHPLPRAARSNVIGNAIHLIVTVSVHGMPILQMEAG